MGFSLFYGTKHISVVGDGGRGAIPASGFGFEFLSSQKKKNHTFNVDPEKIEANEQQ